MEKYEQHGLTRTEDGILGSFGMAEIVEEETLDQQSFSYDQREAAKSLIRKGLLTRQLQDDDSIVYKLTPKGAKLWHVRAEEETLEPPKTH